MLLATGLLAACAQHRTEPTPSGSPVADAGSAVTAQAAAPATAPSAPASAPAAAPPPPPLPHEEAVLSAATTLFSKAKLTGVAPTAGADHFTVVVDPLVDGVSRMQTRTTQNMEMRIVQLARSSFPQFEVRPFSAHTLAQSPLLIVGTFTPINQQGKTEGERSMYRFCLAMVDLKSGRVVSKTVARSRMENVDPTPIAFFADAPAWTKDPVGEAYVKTCQASKTGDAVSPAYVDALVTSALVDEGIRAYNAAHYKDAVALFTQAQGGSAGKQLRVLSGLYLSHMKLGQREAAARDFSQIVDYGLDQGQLAMMFVFESGATVLPADSRRAPNDLWLRQISQRLALRKACVEVAGHASRGGPELINERLSSLRAEYVRHRLVSLEPSLVKRTIAAGYGSREALIGTGKDDASDLLDRRVELKLLACEASG